MYNSLTWDQFLSRLGEGTIHYAEAHGNYYLAINNSNIICVIAQDDASDFEDNYKDDSTAII